MRSAWIHRSLFALALACLCLGAATSHAQSWLATGTYNGNGNDGRAVTGLGFRPDVVFVTSEGNAPTHCRTVSMPAGLSRSIGTNDGLVPGRLVSLDADGFTVDNAAEVNGASDSYHWVAMRAVPGVFELGTYRGDGQFWQDIFGLQGQPSAVVVMSETAEQTILRTGSMGDFVSYPLRGENPLNDGISDFHADGFHVGPAAAVNDAGVDYHFLVWYDSPGTVVHGSLLGDDGDPRTVSGLGLDPAWVLMRGGGNEDGVHRGATLVGDATQFFQDRGDATGGILSLDAGGFTVGNRAETNRNGITYNWLAFADAIVASDLQLAVVADDMSPDPGDAVTFDLTLTNLGAAPAGTIVTTGSLPAGLTFVSATTSQGTFDDGTGVWQAGALDAGASATLEIVATVDADQAGRLLDFTTKVTSAVPADGTPGNDTADVALTVPAVDMAVAVTLSDTVVAAGESVIVGISATNRGPSAASGLVLDVLRDPRLEVQFVSPSLGAFDAPSGVWTVGDLASGTTASLVLATRVAAESAGDTLEIAAGVGWLDQTDTDGTNDTDQARVRVPATVEAADLGILVEAGEPAPQVGSSVAHTITLLNSGPDAATGVTVAVDLPAQLVLTDAAPSLGSYDGAGTWTVGPLAAAGSATLVLTADVLPAAAGLILATSATAAGDQIDPVAPNNGASAAIDVPVPAGSDHVEIMAVNGGAVTVRPGDANRPVLQLSIVNHGAVADTVRQLAFANLTEGPDYATRSQLDDEWAPLTLIGWNRADPGPTADLGQPMQEFDNGLATFPDLEWILAPGDTFDVSVSASPTFAARDGAVLRTGIAAPTDCLVRQPVHLAGPTPLHSGHDLVVDGFVAIQISLQNVPNTLLAVGSERNLVLDMILPANGFLTDHFYGLNLVNRGTALADDDIERLEVWADGGTGAIEPSDEPLGELVHSGDHWQLTGLHEPVPQAGLRVFVTADIAETAQPARSIRLALPLEYGPAVVMDSGNDGPVDRPLEYKYGRSISVTDRVIVTADPIAPAVVHPGDRGVILMNVVLTNTYAVDQTIESLRLTNGTTGSGPATTAELDGVLQQVVLRYDSDDDGILDDRVLGSGAFFEGAVVFTGLDIRLPADTSVRGFVFGDVSLTAAAEGDRPALYVAGPDDFGIPGATTVATWPLVSESDLVVDGLVAAQVATGPVPVRALAPSDTMALAFDLTVPPNGYKDDKLVGLTLVNRGDAVPADLARVCLWEDDGNGLFEGLPGGDTHLGDMSWLGSAWSSPVLSRPVGPNGLRLFVSVDVAAAPTDSATVRLALPLEGLILDSQNSGPLDTEILAEATLVLTTSPLRSTVVFDTFASTVGQSGTIHLTVHNAGTDSLTGIEPTLQEIVGTAGLSIGTVQPATLDLAVDEAGEFTWSYTATAPGESFVVASAEGSGPTQTFHSAPSPSPAHRVYDPALRLDCYPVTNLPSSVNKGQTGLVPITLTLANSGVETVADVALTGLRLRLTDHAGGAGIVPEDLVDAVTVFEGTNVYAHLTTLPTSGADVDLVFTEPALITHREPVTLGIRLDLKLNTTATSFVVSLEDASFLAAVDAVSGSPVDVVLAEGGFPLRTGEAQLATPAGNLAVAMAAGPDHAASPGQTDISLATVHVTNAAGDASSSAINVSSLAFVLRDGTGAAVTQPLDVLGAVTVRSAYQQHFAGLCTVQSDSILVMEFTTEAVIPADATVDLELLTDLLPGAVPQALVPVLADPDFVTGRDANTGESVSVDASGSSPGPLLNVLAPPSEAVAGGRGLLPPDVAAGADELAFLELTLEHPGAATTASIDVDGLTLLVRDGAGLPLDPALVFDRLRLAADTSVHADLVDPTGSEGLLLVPLSGLTLAPGHTSTLLVTADLDAAFVSGSLQIVLSADGIHLSDAISETLVAVTTAAGVWPLSSGISRVVVPAEELAVGGNNLMPPLLAPGDEAYPVLGLTVRNTASTGGGSIELRNLTVDQPAAGTGELTLGQAAASVQVLRDGQVVGTATDFAGDATAATVAFAPALLIPADGDIQLQIALVVCDDAPSGSVSVLVAEDGLVAATPGGAAGGIRIVPASGQALPLVSLAGTVGKAGLADSYVNFPNPFAAGRESTTFAYALDGNATVTIRVLTPHGEPVFTVLDHEPRSAGFHQSDTWTGLNGKGVTVRNGVYMAEITVEYDDGSRARHLRKVAVVR